MSGYADRYDGPDDREPLPAGTAIDRARSRVAAPAILMTLNGLLGIALWGTVVGLTVSNPLWQVEAMRRLEIPADMLAKHGFAPLGPATGPVKTAIFGYNSARLYKLDLHAELPSVGSDKFAVERSASLHAATRSNAAYGYVARRA